MQSLKVLALTVSEKKPTLEGFFKILCQIRKHLYLPDTNVKNSGTHFSFDLADIMHIHTKFQLNQIRTCIHFSVKIDAAVSVK